MPGDQASSPPPTSGSESQPPLPVIVKVSLPASFGPKHKMVKYTTHDQIWTVKMQLRDLLADVAATQSDLWNWGILDDNCEPIRLNSLPGFKSVSVTKQFMDDGRTFGDYSMQGEVSVTFCPRYRISPVPEKEAAKVNTKKYQKKFIEYFTTRQLDKLKDLLSKGFDLNFHADDGDTPLVLAVRADDKSLIKLFAVDHGAHLDFRTPCGKTPLHWACHLGKYAAARALLAHGAWHSAPEYPSCASPLHSAATAGQAEILAQLLQARADPNVADRANKTPLHAACTASVGPASKGAEQCMRMLIEYGARLDALNDAGNTPLHACAANNAVACARELLKCGANKDLVSSSGKTAHQVALLATNFELAEVIASFTPDQVEKLPSPNPKMYADYEAPPAASAAENPTGSEPVASGMANLSISPSVDNDGQGGSYSPGFTASPESGAASYLTMSMQPDPMASHFGSVSGTQGFMPNGYNTHHQAMDLPPPPPLPPMDYGSLPPPPPLPTGFQSMPGYSSDETSGLPPLPPPPPLSSSDMHYQHGYEGASKIHQPRSLGGTMSGYGSVRMAAPPPPPLQIQQPLGGGGFQEPRMRSPTGRSAQYGSQPLLSDPVPGPSVPMHVGGGGGMYGSQPLFQDHRPTSTHPPSDHHMVGTTSGGSGHMGSNGGYLPPPQAMPPPPAQGYDSPGFAQLPSAAPSPSSPLEFIGTNGRLDFMAMKRVMVTLSSDQMRLFKALLDENKRLEGEVEKLSGELRWTQQQQQQQPFIGGGGGGQVAPSVQMGMAPSGQAYGQQQQYGSSIVSPQASPSSSGYSAQQLQQQPSPSSYGGTMHSPHQQLQLQQQQSEHSMMGGPAGFGMGQSPVQYGGPAGATGGGYPSPQSAGFVQQQQQGMPGQGGYSEMSPQQHQQQQGYGYNMGQGGQHQQPMGSYPSGPSSFAGQSPSPSPPQPPPPPQHQQQQQYYGLGGGGAPQYGQGFQQQQQQQQQQQGGYGSMQPQKGGGEQAFYGQAPQVMGFQPQQQQHYQQQGGYGI